MGIVVKVQELLEDKDQLATASFTDDGDKIADQLKAGGVSIVRVTTRKTIVIPKDDIEKANKLLKDHEVSGSFKLN